MQCPFSANLLPPTCPPEAQIRTRRPPGPYDQGCLRPPPEHDAYSGSDACNRSDPLMLESRYLRDASFRSGRTQLSRSFDFSSIVPDDDEPTPQASVHGLNPCYLQPGRRTPSPVPGPSCSRVASGYLQPGPSRTRSPGSGLSSDNWSLSPMAVKSVYLRPGRRPQPRWDDTSTMVEYTQSSRQTLAPDLETMVIDGPKDSHWKVAIQYAPKKTNEVSSYDLAQLLQTEFDAEKIAKAFKETSAGGYSDFNPGSNSSFSSGTT